MRIFFVFLLSIISLSSTNVEGQNLLLNGDFEKFSKYPTALAQFNEVILDWKNVNLGSQFWPNATPDYLHTNGYGEGQIIGGISTPYAKISPHSGSGLVYLNLYKKESALCEYITQKLPVPLSKGKRYKISFYTTPGTDITYNKLSCNGLGVGFSLNRPVQLKAEKIAADFVVSSTENFDQGGWKKVEFIFTPEKPFQYITIGYFLVGNPTIKPIANQMFEGAGVFIDDVVLEEWSTQKEKQINKKIQDSLLTVQQLEKRKVSISREIKLGTDTFSIAIWDNELEDGDVITLLFNDNVILKEYKLLNKKQILKLRLEQGKENTLVMYAHNLGEVTPNTAAIEILNQEKKTYIMESNLKKSYAIKFKP